MRMNLFLVITFAWNLSIAGEVGNGPDLSGEALPVQADRLISSDKLNEINNYCGKKFFNEVAELLIGDECNTDPKSLDKLPEKIKIELRKLIISSSGLTHGFCVSKKFLENQTSIKDGDPFLMYKEQYTYTGVYLRKDNKNNLRFGSTRLWMYQGLESEIKRSESPLFNTPILYSSKFIDMSIYNSVGAVIERKPRSTYGADLYILGNSEQPVFLVNTETNKIIPLKFSLVSTVSCLIEELNALE